MTTQDDAHPPTKLDRFRQNVVDACRRTGRLQRELADALGIHRQVLSRKLHGAKQSFPTHAEVKGIITVLASWDAITMQVEAIELLSLMGLRAESFSQQAWHSAPLNRLEPAPPPRTPATAAPPPLPSVNASLPAPITSLIGREDQVQRLLDRLRHPSVRELTLLGTGGVGKTRLALEAARAAQREFADGVVFVPLAAIRDAALIPSMIVQALHLWEPVATGDPGQKRVASPEEVLTGFLRDKALLLVLDNVEQIPAIAPFISDLLTTAAALKVLVTSRAVLHLYGEHAFEVPALDICSPEALSDLDEIAQCSAIRLFVERAQAIDPAFQLTVQNAATIAQLCAYLDGLPLAIELAAARTKVLPVPLILERLAGGTGQGLTFLRSRAHNVLPRHQSLYDTLEWSYELLAPAQQRLFRRLSVFLGGWTVQAALAIGMAEGQEATPDEVLELMEALLDQSLVQRMPPGEDPREVHAEPRFHFLELIRDYGLGRLEACGEREELEERHAAYYLALAEGLEPKLSSRELLVAVSRLSGDQDNLRAAIAWAIAHDEAEMAQRLCGALGKYWEACTQLEEARRWMDAALTMTAETTPAIRAKLLKAAAHIALWEMAWERSRALAQEALALYEAIGDVAGKTWALFHIGDTWHMQGDYRLATSYFEESLHLFGEQADWGSYAFTLSRLGAIATLQGNFPQAWAWLSEAVTLHRAQKKQGWLTVTLVSLGVLALVQGDLVQSTNYLREGLLLAQHRGNRYLLALDLIVFGCLLGTRQGPSYAARVCSGAEALFASLKSELPQAYRPLYAAHLANLKTQVDETTWDAWWAEGKALSQEELSMLALAASEATGDQETKQR